MKPGSFRRLLSLTCLFSAAFAHADQGPKWRSWHSQAQGHTGTASSEGTGALFLNPALLHRNEGLALQLYTDLGLNPVLIDYADWAADNAEYFGSIDSLLNHIEPVDNKWAPFAQSMVIGASYDEYSLAFVADLRYDLALSRAVLTPVPGVGASSDFVFALGRSFALPQDYQVGVTARYLYRATLPRQLIGITDPRFYKVYNTLKQETDGLTGIFEKLSVAGDLTDNEQGFGLNLGASHDVGDHWTFGASILDFPAILDGEFLKPQLNFGMNYHLDTRALDGLVTRLNGDFDWQNYLLPGTPWFKQFKAGIGVRGFLETKGANGKSEAGREVALLGLGLNDGYPSFGVRFGYFLYLSYLYTTEETGTYPGQRPLSFHKIAIDVAI